MKISNKISALAVMALMVLAFSGCGGYGKSVDDSAAYGTDLAQQLTGSFGNVSKILGSITDAGSAEKAVPDLNTASEDLDKLAQAAADASPEVQSSLSDIAVSQIPGLNAITDKIYAIPGVETVVKPQVDGLLAKFAGF